MYRPLSSEAIKTLPRNLGLQMSLVSRRIAVGVVSHYIPIYSDVSMQTIVLNQAIQISKGNHIQVRNLLYLWSAPLQRYASICSE